MDEQYIYKYREFSSETFSLAPGNTTNYVYPKVTELC